MSNDFDLALKLSKSDFISTRNCQIANSSSKLRFEAVVFGDSDVGDLTLVAIFGMLVTFCPTFVTNTVEFRFKAGPLYLLHCHFSSPVYDLIRMLID